MAASIPAPFLKTLSTEPKERYNVASEKSLELPAGTTADTDPNKATYTYVKDTKGRIVKQTRVGMSENEGQVMKSTRVTYFDYMSK
jgi:hypothetical protein